MGEQRPDDARIFVRKRDGGDIGVTLRSQTREPSIRLSSMSL